MGELLVFPANVRLDWKVIDRYKHSSLSGLVVSNEGSFITLTPGIQGDRLQQDVAGVADEAVRRKMQGNIFI